jgi:hypothetical protein
MQCMSLRLFRRVNGLRRGVAVPRLSIGRLALCVLRPHESHEGLRAANR